MVIFIKTFFLNLVYNDNLEIMACGIAELLNERWASFDLALIENIFNILIDHLNQQYNAELINMVGADVRVRIFDSLLLVQCHPFTHQLGIKVCFFIFF